MTAQAEFKSDLLRTLQARGYISFDATAPSLHVGSLLQIMMLRRMQQAGHKPIVLMGGGTTKVGDPTDKDQSRPLLTEERIQANIDSIKTVFARFLTFGDGPTDAIMVNNADWLDTLGYVEFLRNYGVHFTINRMLAFDSVRLRLEREQPMTLLEFNYMLMQATDFLELERKYGCQLQMGGSDQWGNILNGVELIRRVDHKQAFGLPSPLLATASGQKMGKKVAGAVWLNVLHGAEAAAAAEEAARVAFEAGGLSADMPTLALKASELAATSHVALMVAAGFAASNSEARKQIANGGFRINGEKVVDPQANVAVSGAEAELRSGKRRVRLVIEP